MIDQIILLTMYFPACILIVFALIQSRKTKIDKTMTNDRFIIMLPDIFVMVGVLLEILIIIIFGGFAIFDPETEDWITSIGFGLFFWLGAYLIIFGKTFRVIVNKDKITVHSAFRKPYTFTFGDITSVVRQVNKNQFKTERMIIKTSNGKRLSVENIEISYETFSKKIQEKVNKKYLSGFD